VLPTVGRLRLEGVTDPCPVHVLDLPGIIRGWMHCDWDGVGAGSKGKDEAYDEGSGDDAPVHERAQHLSV